MTFRYFSVFMRDAPDRPRGLFAFNREGERLDTIVWNHVEQAWRHDPGVVTRYYFSEDYEDERAEVDRARAEQIARDHLHTELPSEDQLMAITDEAEQTQKRRG